MNKKLRILICSLFSATAIFALAFAVGCDTETDTSDSQSTSVSDSGAENTDYDFTNATWSWTENSDGTYSVTVTVKDNNGGTDLSVTADNVTVTSEVKTAATCKSTGITTYTATFTYGGNSYSATKDVVTAIDPDNHAEDSVTHTAAVASTADSEGNIEYWYCKDCGKYYSDEDLTTEITQAETVVSVVYTVSLSTSYDEANVAYTSKATFTALADGAYTFSLNAEDVDPDIYVLIESANSTEMVSATDTITILVAEGETVSVTLVDRNAQESSTYALDYTYVTYVSDAVIPEELVVDGDTIATLDTLYCGFNLEYTVSTDSEGEYTFTLSGDDLSGVNVTFYVVNATGGYSWLAWVGSSSTTTTVSLSAGTTIWIDASYNGEDEVSFVLTTTIGSGETEEEGSGSESGEEGSGSSTGETDVETLTTVGGEWTLSQGETVDLYVSVGGSYTITVDDEGFVCIWSDYAYSTIEDGVYIGDNYIGTRTVSLGEGETITIEAEYASTVTITYNSTEEEGSGSGDDKDAFNVPGETSITVATYGEFLEYVEAPSTGYYTFTITCNSVDLDSTDRIYIYLYTDYEGDEKVSLNSSSYTYTTYYAESDIIQINIVNGDWEDDTFLLTITFSETDPAEEGSSSGSSESDVITLTTGGGTYNLSSDEEIKLCVETAGYYTFSVDGEGCVQLVSDLEIDLDTVDEGWLNYYITDTVTVGGDYDTTKIAYLDVGETITVTALYASALTVTYSETDPTEEDSSEDSGESSISTYYLTGGTIKLTLSQSTVINLYVYKEGYYTFSVDDEGYVQLVSDSADSELGTAAKIGDNYLNYKTVYLAKGETITVTVIYSSSFTVAYSETDPTEEEGSSSGSSESDVITLTTGGGTYNLSSDEEIELNVETAGYYTFSVDGEGCVQLVSDLEIDLDIVDEGWLDYYIVGTVTVGGDYGNTKIAYLDVGETITVTALYASALTVTYSETDPTEEDSSEDSGESSIVTYYLVGGTFKTTLSQSAVINLYVDIGGYFTFSVDDEGSVYLVSDSFDSELGTAQFIGDNYIGTRTVYLAEGETITVTAMFSSSLTVAYSETNPTEEGSSSEESTENEDAVIDTTEEENEDEVIDTTEEENEDAVIYTTEEESEDAIIDGE